MQYGISACVIVYNEERVIARCLESLQWADEVVIVDAFSTDRTVEIARRYTDHVFQHPWSGHVAQKNIALRYAQYAWVFAIDADEVVSEELRDRIRTVTAEAGALEGYFVRRRVFYLGRWVNHCGWYPEYKLRLFRRGRAAWGGVDPHDRILLDGRAGRLQGDLYHYPYQDVSHHLEKINRYSSIAAEEMTKRGKRFHWWQVVVHPLVRFIKMYLLKRGFLDGGAGLMVCLLGALYVSMKYIKLWEVGRCLQGPKGCEASSTPCGYGTDVAGGRGAGS